MVQQLHRAGRGGDGRSERSRVDAWDGALLAVTSSHGQGHNQPTLRHKACILQHAYEKTAGATRAIKQRGRGLGRRGRAGGGAPSHLANPPEHAHYVRVGDHVARLISHGFNKLSQPNGDVHGQPLSTPQARQGEGGTTLASSCTCHGSPCTTALPCFEDFQS
jgi:hypothetical protein